MDHLINLIITAILTLCAIVMAVVGVVDNFLANIMTAAGISPSTQIIVLMVVAVCLVVAALRAFGGFVALMIIILLLLVLLHRLLPHLSVQQFDLLPGLPSQQNQPQ